MPSLETRNSQETLKKISLEKLPRILLETKKQKNKKKKKKTPKISMRKTHTFLEKFAPKSVNRDTSKLIHPPYGAAKPPNWSHYFPWWRGWAKAIEKQTKREDERKSLGMKQGETIEMHWCSSGERREKKRVNFFFYNFFYSIWRLY